MSAVIAEQRKQIRYVCSGYIFVSSVFWVRLHISGYILIGLFGSWHEEYYLVNGFIFLYLIFCIHNTSLHLFAQATITKYHRWYGLNNTHLVLTIFNAQKSKIKITAKLVPEKDHFPDLHMTAFLLYSQVIKRATSLSLSVFL